MSSANTITAKLVELESKLIEEQRVSSTLKAQLEISQERCKKFENECDELKLNEEVNKHKEGNQKSLEYSVKTYKEERDAAMEKLG